MSKYCKIKKTIFMEISSFWFNTKFSINNFWLNLPEFRAASPKYQLDLEIAKKIEFLQTRPEWSPTGTSYKNIV